MNARERFLSVMEFSPCGRTLLWEWGYWGGSVNRWYKEGLPLRRGLLKPVEYGETVAGPGAAWRSGVLGIQEAEDVSIVLGFDKGRETIPLQNFFYPPYERKILDEDKEYIVYIDEMGITARERKNRASKPQFLNWPVKNRDDWEQIKAERFQIRIEDRLPQNYCQLIHEYRNRDYPLSMGSGYCGFFGSLRALVGEKRLFYMYYDDPELVHDILNFLTDFWIEIYGKVLEEVRPDSAEFWEDMCYKNGSLISPALFREFMMPCYQKLIGFLRSNGIRHFCVDSDGDVQELIPLFLECGMTGMLPFEAQAGNDIVEIRKHYPQLQIYGGINKNLIAQGKRVIDVELGIKLPFLLQQGGYIPFLDHLVPPTISWRDFQYYRKRVKELAMEFGRGYG